MHCFILIFTQKKTHPDKITHEEEDAVKDPAIRKSIKEAAAEFEKTEGRGQIKVSATPVIVQFLCYK